jgi:hypothetical protein
MSTQLRIEYPGALARPVRRTARRPDPVARRANSAVRRTEDPTHRARFPTRTARYARLLVRTVRARAGRFVAVPSAPARTPPRTHHALSIGE